MIVVPGVSLGAEPPRVTLTAGARCRPTPNMVAVAIHEAGHAVVASTYAVTVSHATILCDLETYGCVWFSPESWVRAPFEVHLLALLSGQAAQDRGATMGLCPFVGPFDATDTAKARAILATQIDAEGWLAPSVDAGLVEWREHVSHSVNATWPSIVRVATALLERKCLTGPEVEALR